ncbi:hypothetical protein SDC9_82782 [bioreactor metagenome]|uniref:HTH gntR-type domain-containing protein n=1 Tax=bioreactor metagenome TaxID=1076179 RepID=A0A644Z6D9_9ZZZZ|nr:GntR family transcriptional regulator [Erysipelotrichaceae bacterium]
MDSFLPTQPIYIQIIDRIKKEIVSEVLKPAAALPSVRDLAMKYKVNPNTAQRALSELERSGLVRSDRNIGRYVTDDIKLIKELHGQMVTDITNRFVNELEELKVSEEESILQVQMVFKERKNHD